MCWLKMYSTCALPLIASVNDAEEIHCEGLIQRDMPATNCVCERDIVFTVFGSLVMALMSLQSSIVEGTL